MDAHRKGNVNTPLPELYMYVVKHKRIHTPYSPGRGVLTSVYP